MERERELSRAGSSAVGSDGRTDESRPPSHQVVGSRAFALWKTQEHGKGGGYGGRRRRRTAILFHPVKDREKREERGYGRPQKGEKQREMGGDEGPAKQPIVPPVCTVLAPPIRSFHQPIASQDLPERIEKSSSSSSPLPFPLCATLAKKREEEAEERIPIHPSSNSAQTREEKKKRQTRTRSVRTRRRSTDESQLSELVSKRSLCSSLFFFFCSSPLFISYRPCYRFYPADSMLARRLSFFFFLLLSIENYKLKKETEGQRKINITIEQMNL